LDFGLLNEMNQKILKEILIILPGNKAGGWFGIISDGMALIAGNDALPFVEIF